MTPAGDSWGKGNALLAHRAARLVGRLACTTPPWPQLTRTHPPSTWMVDLPEFQGTLLGRLAPPLPPRPLMIHTNPSHVYLGCGAIPLAMAVFVGHLSLFNIPPPLGHGWRAPTPSPMCFGPLALRSVCVCVHGRRGGLSTARAAALDMTGVLADSAMTGVFTRGKAWESTMVILRRGALGRGHARSPWIDSR